MPTTTYRGYEFPNPNQFEKIGLKTVMSIDACHEFSEIVLDGELYACNVDESFGKRTYVIVFEGGGTCEFDVDSNGSIPIMDSHGIDFAWFFSSRQLVLSPHRPSFALGSRSTWGREEIEIPAEDKSSDRPR